MKVLITGGRGYIGSRLAPYLRDRGHAVDTIDTCVYGQEDGLCNNKVSFSWIPEWELTSYEAIIHLAGHSSVAACDIDPRGSFQNNCLDFFHLVRKMRTNQKLIYASSASVYGNDRTDKIFKETDKLSDPIKPYDWQKATIDQYMKDVVQEWYGLRFGTVCGYSPVPRNELLLNSMVRAGVTKNRVTVTDSKANRSILGLNDLCRAVLAIIENPKKWQGELDNIFNLASFSTDMHTAGKAVADHLSANFDSFKAEGPNAYSFMLDTSKFQRRFNFHFEDTFKSIIEECKHNDLTVERNWNSLLAV